jgi:GNAT superfamily N-acetyltransferase
MMDGAKILSAHDVDPELLIEFYNLIYPQRTEFLAQNWGWLNNSQFFSNKTPLVIEYKNKIIGHAGIIPFPITLNGQKMTAAWFIDFAILPEFQRRGLGVEITRRWAEFSDVQLALTCNKMSSGLFDKCGWLENFNTYLHIFPIVPFNHPGFVRRLPNLLCGLLNTISIPFYSSIYKKYSVNISESDTATVNDESVRAFIDSSEGRERYPNTVYPIRDSEYYSWRLFNSPDFNKYRIIGADNLHVIFKYCDNEYSKYIDIFQVSGMSDCAAIRKIIASLALMGKREGYFFIRFYTSNGGLSDFLRKSLKSIVSRPVYKFFARSEEVLSALDRSTWNWQLIDNDFEKF